MFVRLLLALATWVSTLPACTTAPRWSDPAVLSDTPPEPQREFRAMWVATVANIDWPSKPGLTPDALRAEIDRHLDTAVVLNLNAVILQVRPCCDALYPSALEPWSEYLTGVQGQAPADNFDPLQTWIDAAHARGLQLHAWFNPYRARHLRPKSPNAPTHIASTRPDLVRTYDGYQWLDPAEPDAQAHSLAVILDVVSRYNIDGVHLDDYFYPYPKKDVPFPDGAAWSRYQSAGGTLSRDDFRRDQINSFVRRLYEQTKALKPHVRVGISPFGIWRPGHPASVAGFDAYAGLYADARLWLKEGWVDYLAPQLYWKISAPKQAYADLLTWWLDQNPRRRDVYVGNYASRVLADDATKTDDDQKTWPPHELVNQVLVTRDLRASGNIHFSAVALTNNRRGLADALREGVYAQPALAPPLWWNASGPLPQRLKPVIERSTAELRIAPAAALPPGHTLLLWTRHPTGWTLSTHTTTPVILPAERAATANRLVIAAMDRFGRIGPLTGVDLPAPPTAAANNRP